MNFALILFCLLVASAAVWFADVLVFRKLRQARRAQILAHARGDFMKAGPDTDCGPPGDETQHMAQDSWLADACDRCHVMIRMAKNLLAEYGKRLSDNERVKILAAIKNAEEEVLSGRDVAAIRQKSVALGAAAEMFFKDPWWVEYGASFFPVILIVFMLRSFIVEPFKIPSGSMIPTLLVGDFILVNKFAYGIRLPVINKKIVEIGTPRKGEVMVFRSPEDPSIDYIKRVIGVPGDRVAYQNKQLTINGEPVEKRRIDDYLHPERLYYSRQFTEKIDEVAYRVLNDQDAPPFIQATARFPYRENCHYNSSGVVCTIPEGHYFMMGDNRDNSLDSRFWGFVPDGNIVGKAFFIWLNFSDLGRIGSFK